MTKDSIEKFLATVDQTKIPRGMMIGPTNTLSWEPMYRLSGYTNEPIGNYEMQNLDMYSLDNMINSLTRIRDASKNKLYCFVCHDEYSDKITTSFAEVVPETDEQYCKRASKEMERTKSRDAEERRQYDLLKKKFG